MPDQGVYERILAWLMRRGYQYAWANAVALDVARMPGIRIEEEHDGR